MAQPTAKILTENEINADNYRDKFVEVATAPNDFATGDSSIICSTIPFLPAGDSFTDIPMYPIGLTQNFAYNEGVNGQFVPEIGSARKANASGSASGSGSISKLLVHGNSLGASLFRPMFFFMATVDYLSALQTKLFTTGSDLNWIKGLAVEGVDLFSVDITDALDHVIATGGLNSVLFKLPFGLIEIKRDARERVVSINFLEQCALRGSQSGLSAGQFQIADNLSFEFERVRPLLVAGPYNLSSVTADGIKTN